MISMLEGGGVRRQEIILSNKSCFGWGGGQGIAFNCVEEKVILEWGGVRGQDLILKCSEDMAR